MMRKSCIALLSMLVTSVFAPISARAQEVPAEYQQVLKEYMKRLADEKD